MLLDQDYSLYTYHITCLLIAYLRLIPGNIPSINIVITAIASSYSFNRVDLPPYETVDKLKEKLTCAIEETAGFHVE